MYPKVITQLLQDSYMLFRLKSVLYQLKREKDLVIEEYYEKRGQEWDIKNVSSFLNYNMKACVVYVSFDLVLGKKVILSQDIPILKVGIYQSRPFEMCKSVSNPRDQKSRVNHVSFSQFSPLALKTSFVLTITVAVGFHAFINESGEDWSVETPKRDTNGYPHITLCSVGEYGRQVHGAQPSRAYFGKQRPTGSQSTPLRTIREKNTKADPQDRLDFLRDMQKTRDDMKQFRNEMNGLAKEIDSMTFDIVSLLLNLDKISDRVILRTDPIIEFVRKHWPWYFFVNRNSVVEIEQDLTATQEVNVNLQILLENALESQKEEDVHATQAIKSMYSDLATVAYENNQLRGRLSLIEKGQKKHKGSIYDVEERIKEYTSMLGQAQDTIHMLQEPRSRMRLDESLLHMPLDAFNSRRTSETLSWPESTGSSLQKESESTFSRPHINTDSKLL
ncbi:hypothetical protein F4703DRAFT_1794524 [Phycomyces blakesleeanus]